MGQGRRKPGRPRVYSDQDLERAYQLIMQYKTYAEVSMETGIGISTIAKYVKRRTLEEKGE